MQAVVMDEVDEEAMEAFISDRVKEGATVYTDGSHVYDGLWAGGFEPEAVIHSHGEYVRGEAPHQWDRSLLVDDKAQHYGRVSQGQQEAPGEVCRRFCRKAEYAAG